jgi:hypothetical protein
MLVITPTFTPNFNTNFGANAAAARAAWIAAASVFASNFTDSIHINIIVDAVTDPTVFGESNSAAFFPISYANLRTRLMANATTANDTIALGPGGSVPAADPTGGTGSFFLTRSQAKALGVIGDDLSNDGMTTFGVTTSFTFSGPIAPGTFDFQGIAAHEISEVLGRIGFKGTPANDFSLLDLFSYTAAGVRDMVGGPNNNFSIDNGTTLLKLFNDPTTNGLDSRDWASGTPGTPPDSFNQISDPSVVNPVTAVDLQLLDVIGYDLVSVPAAAVPAPVFRVVRSVVRPGKS